MREAEELVYFFWSQLIGLGSRSEFNDLHSENGGELCRSRSGPGPSCSIGVEHEDDLIEVGSDQLGLAGGQPRAHKSRDIRMSGLVDFHGVKVAFHKNERAVARADGSVEIEQQVRFPEAGRKAVFRFRFVDGATRVGDEFVIFVVDRNHNPTTEKTAPVVVAHAEVAHLVDETPGNPAGQL